MWFTSDITECQIDGNRTSPRIIVHCAGTTKSLNIGIKRVKKVSNTTHRSEVVVIDYEILEFKEVVQTGRKGAMK